jgi:hypothetical protein
MLKLVGDYQTDNTNFLNVSQSGLHLVIGTRKKPTPQKPKKYLLQKVSPTKYIYISSLFEWQEMTDNGITAYSIDYEGVDYVFRIDHNTKTASISLLNQTPSKGVVQPNDL